MTENAFRGYKAAPQAEEVAAALGEALGLWEKLVAEVRETGKIDGMEWSSYSVKAGWSMRAKAGKRTVVYLIPHAGSCSVGFVFGERAVGAIRGGEFGAEIVELVERAPRYAEGRGVRMDIRSAADVAMVGRLIAVKLAN